jgi:RNA polymerase sigma factor (sigma-70 family)
VAPARTHDLVQETFLKAARAPRSIPSGLADEEAWLVRVLVNIPRDRWRKAAVRRRYDDEQGPSSAVRTDPEAALVAHTAVWSALETLPPRRRSIVLMRELEGLTVNDIASVLGITSITVRWHHQPGPGVRAARVGNSNRTVYLHPEIVVTNTDIAFSNAIPGSTPSQQFWIDVRLNAAGAAKMRQATTNHLGRPIAILIDGDVVTAPTLKSPIGAAAAISGDYTQVDAQSIAAGMSGVPR